MALTYEPIATTTLGSAQSSITFSSIPSTYTDLVLVIASKSDSNNTQYLRFNSDSGTNYSNTRLYGDGTSATSGRNTSQTQLPFPVSAVGGADATNPTVTICNIQNYANSTTYKTTLIRDNNAGIATSASVGLWQSTSAINTILVSRSGGNYNAGSTFTLYGIKAA